MTVHDVVELAAVAVGGGVGAYVAAVRAGIPRLLELVQTAVRAAVRSEVEPVAARVEKLETRVGKLEAQAHA
ncbi:hypothetical protein ACLEPN_05485 [Myxococcus sp. 1LA]